MKVGPLETAAAELRAGRHGSAERKLKRLLKSRPRDPIARHLLGLAHLARGEPGPAVRQFRLAVDAGAGTDAEVNLALALVAGERHGEAEQALRAAVENAPSHVGAVFNLGHLLRIVGSPGEAAAWLRRALELDDAHAAARLELGLALMETGAFDEAQRCLAAVLAREPGHQVAILNIARIDQRLGRFPYAINELLRIFAWTMILANEGTLNSFLDVLGIISLGDDETIHWLASNGAVFCVVVYAYILFMVFPVYNTIETLDPNQIEAAKDLGASTLRTHLRVVLPHAKPGIADGAAESRSFGLNWSGFVLNRKRCERPTFQYIR